MISGKADGQWISGDCDNMQIGFACQMGKQASCGDYNEYGGKCYKAYDERLSYDAAESLCNGECGHLVSIHSVNENMMVYDLLPNNGNYARIGLKHSDVSFAWSDNTNYDYDNFGNSNPAFGDCVAMSLIPELVEKERWITISCTVELPFVCERAQGACLGPATTSVPTLAPPTCNGAYFMEENGTFYSPGYPASYHDYKTCIYVMTVTPGDLVQIHFVDVQLSAPSIIELYNNFADVDPFEIISSDIPSTKYFVSTTNVMKMAFVAGNNGSAINRWEAVFSSKSKTVTTISTVTVTPSPLNPSGCNENSVVPSNITSPRYPANYPPLTQCRYQLTSDSSHRPVQIENVDRIFISQVYFNDYFAESNICKLSTSLANPNSCNFRIQLTFGAIDTEQCCDIIDVYDFDGSPYYPLLDRFSGQIAAGAKVFKSSMNQLFVDFYSDSINQRSGFTAVAVPIL
ncbi:lectin C-type domain protein [Necator americanus]|uniref:Lectin C-type domain protein n=1 Tax=Necator americanus TaxID=51031 RepID=W2TYY7_NECAM|nr:lectin C-type domain protein [Necator americanus]ETN87083.1 lectin C-type domain protein [Necator americanus]